MTTAVFVWGLVTGIFLTIAVWSMLQEMDDD